MWLIKKSFVTENWGHEVIIILTLQPLTALFLFPKKKNWNGGGKEHNTMFLSANTDLFLGSTANTEFYFIFLT